MDKDALFRKMARLAMSNIDENRILAATWFGLEKIHEHKEDHELYKKYCREAKEQNEREKKLQDQVKNFYY